MMTPIPSTVDHLGLWKMDRHGGQGAATGASVSGTADTGGYAGPLGEVCAVGGTWRALPDEGEADVSARVDHGLVSGESGSGAVGGAVSSCAAVTGRAAVGAGRGPVGWPVFDGSAPVGPALFGKHVGAAWAGAGDQDRGRVPDGGEGGANHRGVGPAARAGHEHTSRRAVHRPHRTQTHTPFCRVL